MYIFLIEFRSIATSLEREFFNDKQREQLLIHYLHFHYRLCPLYRGPYTACALYSARCFVYRVTSKLNTDALRK